MESAALEAPFYLRTTWDFDKSDTQIS